MADTKKEQERDELHRAIRAIADDLRGSVDGWDFKSTGVKDGKRTFDWPCIIRAINTTDVMEVTVEHLSNELIDHLVNRIITEVPGINRVLFDYTPKPPATVEYE